MRLFVALGILLTALLALTVKAMVRRPHHHPPPVEAEADATLPAAPPSEAPERRGFDRAPRFQVGPAHIFGRVLPPPGEVLGRRAFTVTADGGRRVVEALTFPDGRFDVHLPPGQYAVVASFGAWVGLAAGVAARSGGEHELSIVLGPTASLGGTIRLPAGAEATVEASLAGRDEWDEGEAATAGDGTFQVEGLVPGRRYDLRVEGQGLRAATVRSVTAPASELLVQVDALPILRGAIGFPSGGDCPIGHVGLFAPDALPASDDALNGGEEVEQSTAVDGDCRFELSVPEGASEMTLLAVGAGWHLEQPISIPPLGDPAPVCLNPPCDPKSAE